MPMKLAMVDAEARGSLPRIFLPGVLLELDVVKAVRLPLDPAHVDRLHDVARLRIDPDRSARALKLEPFESLHRSVAVDFGAPRAERGTHGRDRGHAIVAADGHEVRAELFARDLGEGCLERGVLRGWVRRRVVMRR